jgi:alpha-galactosidase
VSQNLRDFYHLHNNFTSVVVDCRHNQPVLSYFGKRLVTVNASMLSQLDRHEAPASLPIEPAISLTPTIGEGFLGHLGLEVHRSATQWSLSPKLAEANASQFNLELISRCAVSDVELTHQLQLDPIQSVLCVSASVRNLSDQATLFIDNCASTLPLPDHLTELEEVTGRWAYEFQTERHAITHSAYVRENWTGRTSHHMNPTLTLLEKATSATHGDVLGVHLGWSGNHQMWIESLADGRRMLQAGELLRPGELELGPGEEYQSPSLYLCHSSQGQNGLTHQWHQMIRREFIAKQSPASTSRPVQLNTWEALYFAVDESSVLALVDQAAGLGIERFVLDDGWFLGRIDDRRALGDWAVDPQKFPNGLTPLIEACHEQGMEFGLWIEPEMVSQKSKLFETHPDWVLHHKGVPLKEARQQLVLDLSQPAVVSHLFDAISSLLSAHPIAYIKWDMNRDIHQAGNAEGRHASHRQTRALYRLLNQVKTAFPEICIESCASGGGRADLGILEYTSRVWPSDTNDALDRLRVQRGFQRLFPPELMGSHVGPSPCHITGRQHSMAFRAGVAFWGHMGVEANVRELSDTDRQVLSEAIALHKHHRELIHGGSYQFVDRPVGEQAWMVLAPDHSEALAALATLETPTTPFPSRYRFIGLEPDRQYELKLVWPGNLRPLQKNHRDALTGTHWSGDWLMSVGLSLPILQPESLLIYHLKAV